MYVTSWIDGDVLQDELKCVKVLDTGADPTTVGVSSSVMVTVPAPVAQVPDWPGRGLGGVVMVKVPVKGVGKPASGGIVYVTVSGVPTGEVKPAPDGPAGPAEGDRGIVMVSIVRGNHVDSSPGLTPGEVTGVWVTRVDSDEKKVTVTTGPWERPEPPGAVITVDQVPGIPESGTVTVRTSVAVLLGPSGMVTVSTEPADVPWAAGTVTVTPEVGAAGMIGTVIVVPEPGIPDDSGIVTVTKDRAELSLPPGPVVEPPEPGVLPEGGGKVTVRTGTVTVLLEGVGA